MPSGGFLAGLQIITATGSAPESLYQIAYGLAILAGPIWMWYNEPPTYNTERAYLALYIGFGVALAVYSGVEYGISGLVAVIYGSSLAVATLAGVVFLIAIAVGALLGIDQLRSV